MKCKKKSCGKVCRPLICVQGGPEENARHSEWYCSSCDSSYQMSNDEWLDCRRQGIGG